MLVASHSNPLILGPALAPKTTRLPIAGQQLPQVRAHIFHIAPGLTEDRGSSPVPVVAFGDPARALLRVHPAPRTNASQAGTLDATPSRTVPGRREAQGHLSFRVA